MKRKNVLAVRTKMGDRMFYGGCQCASLWREAKVAQKKEVYAHRDGYLKRIIHISDIAAIVPRCNEAKLTYKISKVQHAWTMESVNHLLRARNGEVEEMVQVNPNDTVYCTVDPITMAIEMPLEEVAECITVRDFVKNTLIFWSVVGKKKFQEDALVEVFANKRTHSEIMTAKELLEKHGNQKIFCLLHCNDYSHENTPSHHIVLF